MGWIGCATGREYFPSNKQVFIVPRGSVITSPEGNPIITDGSFGKTEMGTAVVPYDGVLVSKDRFDELFEKALEGAGKK